MWYSGSTIGLQSWREAVEETIDKHGVLSESIFRGSNIIKSLTCTLLSAQNDVPVMQKFFVCCIKSLITRDQYEFWKLILILIHKTEPPWQTVYILHLALTQRSDNPDVLISYLNHSVWCHGSTHFNDLFPYTELSLRCRVQYFVVAGWLFGWPVVNLGSKPQISRCCCWGEEGECWYGKGLRLHSLLASLSTPPKDEISTARCPKLTNTQ